MLGRPLYSKLEGTDGGYGRPFDAQCLSELIERISPLMALKSDWQLPLLNLAESWNAQIADLPVDETAGMRPSPYGLRNHLSPLR